MIRRPPRSTPFPTRRSSDLAEAHDVAGAADRKQLAPAPHVEGPVLQGLFRERVSHAFQIDRKSTRLNSSHANISYAVFCLKKKYNSQSFVHTFLPFFLGSFL